MKDNVEQISITGGSGFIGRSLISRLMARQNVHVNVLVRRRMDWRDSSNVSYIEGDLLKADTLHEFVTQGCMVINLAYLRHQTSEANKVAVLNLLDVCERKGVRRLIHCSTATVAGEGKDEVVCESTACKPANSYERTKLSLEEIILKKSEGKYESVIVRPTAVFGPNGMNLLKLARNLSDGMTVSNYIRSCLFNYRRMNLVCVENVVAALEYFIDTAVNIDRNVYLVSDDDELGNNYGRIESRLMDLMGIRKYPIPVIPLPKCILRALLVASRRGNAGVNRIYSCKKLLQSGFKKQITLDEGLVRFAEWYMRIHRATGMNEQRVQ